MNGKCDTSGGVKALESNRPKDDQDLDEALEDTFPASDPISFISKGEPSAPRRDAENDRDNNEDEGKKE